MPELADRMPGDLDPRVRSERWGADAQAPTDRSAAYRAPQEDREGPFQAGDPGWEPSAGLVDRVEQVGHLAHGGASPGPAAQQAGHAFDAVEVHCTQREGNGRQNRPGRRR